MNRFAIYTLFAITALAANAQTPLSEAFDERNFTITVTDMYPAKYTSRHGLTEFSLTLRNDSALVYMPYMGEVHVPVYNNDGLRFEEPYKNLQAGTTRKGDGLVVTFTAKHQMVAYQFVVTAYKNHTADVMVIPDGADVCRYSGQWQSAVRKKFAYLALVLDSASHAQLMEFEARHRPWDTARTYCHHMTIAFNTNATQQVMKWVTDHQGRHYDIVATHFGHSDKAFAVKVDPGKVPSVNTLTHVTMSINTSAGGQAVDSNYITKWETMPQPIKLSGIVTIVYR